MADLDELRKELKAARSQAEQARQETFVAQRRLERLERDLGRLQRSADDRDPEHAARLAELRASIEKGRATIGDLTQKQAARLADLERVQGRVAEFGDPRQATALLSARFPILLFPLRLETRFVRGRDGSPGQLLVRVYPDDCSIDSFEPDLSESEVKNLRRYWCSVWNAGGDLGRWKAAFRELASAHGPGRGLYLLQRFQPLPGSDATPARTSDAQVILVIPVSAPITDPDERRHVEEYWITTFRTNSEEAGFGALVAALGETRANEIRKSVVPYNRGERLEPGVDRALASVSVVFLVLRSVEEAAVKRQAWTRAPEARLLPERFLLVCERGGQSLPILGERVRQPLAVGPDPLAEEADQFARSGGDLDVPAQLRWMTDFDAALDAGMAFRVDLTPEQAEHGFDRLYVLGVRMGSDPETARGELEQLLEHHFYGKAGFSLLPQGVPTNNSEQGSSVWARVQEADELFEAARSLTLGVDQFDPNATGRFELRDGLALSSALGIDPAVLQRVPHADGLDQAEARAMNAALFPATLGYFLNTQLEPIFDEGAVEQIRRHFIDWVSARGVVPAVRIGRQPYGILPTAAFSRWAYPAAPDVIQTHVAFPRALGASFLERLHELLAKLGRDFWDPLARTVPHVGQATSDPERLLLDILGLHASSVDFHLQVLDSADRIWNTYRFWGPRGDRLEAAMRAEMERGRELLRTLGHTGSDPEIIEKFFSSVEGPAERPTIQEGPLSEVEPLRPCTPEGQNYLEWCRNRAVRAFDELRREHGFSDGAPPDAFLYHLLRHAIELSYHHVAVRLLVLAKLISPAERAKAYREPTSIHVVGLDRSPASESRYRHLYRKARDLTGDEEEIIAAFIPRWLETEGRESALAEQLAAIEIFERAPTARLERLFAEHIDLCSYRWDAWLLSLVNQRLAALPRAPSDDTGRPQGLYLGAFGWVEDLRPDTSTLEPVTLEPELAAVFETEGTPPLRRDPENGGHLLAPSLNHAVTAAVLRNGYLVNASPSQPDLFAVDLSSARVRVALQFLEGVRNGQPLGALLGYQLERRLHDRHGSAEADALIYEVRKAFPLVAKKNAATVDPAAEEAAIESLEARNVCDGVALLEHVRKSPVKVYPWGKPLRRMPGEAVLNEEVSALFEIQDAIADLLLAESVHQVTLGNSERAAAALDAGGKGGFPPEPEVVRTPRSGTALTHRVALHLPASVAASATATPRARLEPALDAWVGSVLPPLSELTVCVHYRNSTPGSSRETTSVSIEELGLSPVDTLYLLDPADEVGMSDLDERVACYVRRKHGLCPDAELVLAHTAAVPGTKTIFECAPLLDSLRSVLLSARPLAASDAALPNEAGTALTTAVVSGSALDEARRVVDELLNLGVSPLLATVEPLARPDADFAAVIAGVDAAVTAFLDLQERAGLCGVALSGGGRVQQGVSQFFSVVRSKARELSRFWDEKQARYLAALAEAEAGDSGESARLAALVRAERAISTSYTPLAPEPPTFSDFLSIVTRKHEDFLASKGHIEAVRDSGATELSALWSDWSRLSTERRAHDATEVDLEEEQGIVRGVLATMLAQLSGVSEELTKRLSRADALRADSAARGGELGVRLAIDAAKALLGDGCRILPRFSLSLEQAGEWDNAFSARADLLAHLSDSHDFPLDDWLYGIARVRTKLHDLEKIIHLTTAFGRAEPELVALQFPFKAGEAWFALELPPELDRTQITERLLYTGIYASGGFERTATEHVGLLLDEWTEVIPAVNETAGLAFHYDRPNNEPPQTWLLVTPASLGPTWSFEDLVLAIPETFELAKKRAVEPRDISRTPLARLIPATLSAFTSSETTIGTRFYVSDVRNKAQVPHG